MELFCARFLQHQPGVVCRLRPPDFQGHGRAGVPAQPGHLPAGHPGAEGPHVRRLEAIWSVPFSGTVQWRMARCQFRAASSAWSRAAGWSPGGWPSSRSVMDANHLRH